MSPLCNDDGVRGTGRKRRRVRAVQGTIRPGDLGFESLETGRLTIGAPVECYKFTQGASIYRFTSADSSITLARADVGTYSPEAISRSELDFSQEDIAQNVEVSVPLPNAIAQLFRAGIPTGKVLVAIYRKHRSDPEEKLIFSGQIISCTFDGGQAKLSVAPLANVFQRKVPSILYQSQCNWPLYSTGCTVAKAGFKTTGTLSAVGVQLRAPEWAALPDGWFTNGWAEVASTGERRFIVNHVGDTLTVMSAFASLAVGAFLDAFAGCDRTEAVCQAKFNNLVNHLGFPRIPTRNPYGGGSLI